MPETEIKKVEKVYCPVCGNELELKEKYFTCQQGHRWDVYFLERFIHGKNVAVAPLVVGLKRKAQVKEKRRAVH